MVERADPSGPSKAEPPQTQSALARHNEKRHHAEPCRCGCQPCWCRPSTVMDAVAEINALVQGLGPAYSTVHTMLAAAQAQGISFQNMVIAQQQNAMIQQSATVEKLIRILRSGSCHGLARAADLHTIDPPSGVLKSTECCESD